MTFDILWSQTEQIPFKSSLMAGDVHGRNELYAEGMSCLTAGLGGSDGKYRIGGWVPTTKKYKSSGKDH